MTSEGIQNGNGYEHAGGYQPDASLWPSPREIAFGIVIGITVSAANILLDGLVTGAPAKFLFYLLLCAMLLARGIWDMAHAHRLDPEEDVANPMSVLYPERIEDDSKARTRRRRIAALTMMAVSLAGLAYCGQNLLETGIRLTDVPTVILIVAGFILIPLLFLAYQRRRAVREGNA